MQLLLTIKSSSGSIRDLKFSPNDQKFAAATSSRAVDLYTTQDYKRRANLKNLQGPASHLDWSCDSKFVQVTSDRRELLHFDANQFSMVQSVATNQAIRNEDWHTFTCDWGWPVQGTVKDLGKEKVWAVDRSNEKFFSEYQAVAVGDESGKVKVYKYPCVQPHAQSVEAHGHSSAVSNLRWSSDDQFLISTGRDDQTIIVWRVKPAA
jgi:WD40 repeat protein